MKFRTKSDELFHQYFELIEKAVEEIDYANMDEKLVEWSKRIYEELNLTVHDVSTSTNSDNVISSA